MMRRWWLLLVLVLPSASAWNWDTHEAFVEAFYYNVDETTQEHLDLDQLKKGAIAPDKTFRDFKRHGYPYTVERTSYWIEQTKRALEHDDWKNASYAFGVASHYLSDSFSAPHGVAGEAYRDHKRYEDDAALEYLFVPCGSRDYDLGLDLERASHEGETWNLWIKSKDRSYPQETVARSMELVYAVGLDIFDAHCDSVATDFMTLPLVERVRLSLTLMRLVLIVFCVIGIAWLAWSLWKDLKNCSEQFLEPFDDDEE